MDAVISATNEQKQLLQDNGISSFIGKSSTSNGITVTAGQTIVDNYFAYLTFEVEGYIPEDEYQPDFMDTFPGSRYILSSIIWDTIWKKQEI